MAGERTVISKSRQHWRDVAIFGGDRTLRNKVNFSVDGWERRRKWVKAERITALWQSAVTGPRGKHHLCSVFNSTPD